MSGNFVGEHKWLTGHKKIIKKSAELVAQEIIESLNKIPDFPITQYRIGEN